MIGTSLSHYKILAKLGEGGMGKVYLAEDTALKRRVALKMLPEEVSRDASRLKRFHREARTVAKLSHPNIVTIYSVEEALLAGDDSPVHFLTMELIEGATLSDHIPPDGLALERFFELAIPLADAVSSAHEKGITHRDLKPANIMVTSEGRIKVLDFGLAKMVETPLGRDIETHSPTATLTTEGKVVGTVAYMSPQQAEGKPLDHRSDIFSLGVVLWEMATGQRPFKGGSSAQIISAILRDTPPSVAELRAGSPNHLSRIIKHCLEKDPNDRFQTARDVYNELKQLRQESTALASSEALPTRPAVGGEPRVGRLRSASTRILLAGAIGLLGYLLLTKIAAPPGRSQASVTRLAVLQLVNLTGRPSQDFLAQGISSFLINQLSEISEIDVLGSSYVEAYGSGPAGVRRLVRDSGIDAFIEGYIEGAPESVRVYVNLIDATNGSVIKPMDFDGTADAIFELQSRIARAISEELAVRISPESLARLERAPPESDVAFRYFLEGLTLMSCGGKAADAARAESLLRRAVREAPDFAYAHWGLAQALLNSFSAGEGPDFLAQAETAAKTALRLDPGLPRARITLAAIYRESGRLPEAIRELESLAAEKLPSQTQFEELAVSYSDLGDAARSDANIDKALEQRSDSEVFRSLAESYLEAGDKKRALEFHHKAIEADPGQWLSHHQLGLYYLSSRQFEEARLSLQRASDLAPEEQRPIKNLARLELHRSNFEGAIQIYERISTKDIDAFTASNLGTAYFYLEAPGSLVKAAEYYQLAVRLRPRNFQLQANLGDLYVRQGRPTEARAQYSEALRLVQEELETLPTKALLRLKEPVYLAKIERCAEALPLTEGLAADLPKTVDNLRSIAQVFALCGAADRAIDVLEDAVPLGYPPAQLRLEDEFKSLHANPRFEALAGPTVGSRG